MSETTSSDVDLGASDAVVSAEVLCAETLTRECCETAAADVSTSSPSICATAVSADASEASAAETAAAQKKEWELGWEAEERWKQNVVVGVDGLGWAEMDEQTRASANKRVVAMREEEITTKDDFSEFLRMRNSNFNAIIARQREVLSGAAADDRAASSSGWQFKKTAVQRALELLTPVQLQHVADAHLRRLQKMHPSLFAPAQGTLLWDDGVGPDSSVMSLFAWNVYWAATAFGFNPAGVSAREGPKDKSMQWMYVGSSAKAATGTPASPFTVIRDDFGDAWLLEDEDADADADAGSDGEEDKREGESKTEVEAGSASGDSVSDDVPVLETSTAVAAAASPTSEPAPAPSGSIFRRFLFGA